MRFLSLLAITSMVLCVSMCTPNNSNNVTPATGNCRDGIQNGDEQGVDCGAAGCAYPCNGNMTVTAATITYSSGQVTSSSPSAAETCFTTNPPTVGGSATRNSTTLTTYFYKNGTSSFAYNMNMKIYYGGSPAVGSYTYSNGGYCLGGVINQFSIISAYTGSSSGCVSGSSSGAGTLNITNVNTTTRKMSGNFSATLQCSGNYPISGTFTDVSY